LSTTVLVAEDFTSVRQMLVKILETIPNIRVICEVADGLHAVEKANALQPDLILLDIGLPSLSGIEVARKLKELSPTVRIIFVTQQISPEVVIAAFEAGASGYVVKMDMGRELRNAVQAVLQGGRFLSSTVHSVTANLQPPESTVLETLPLRQPPPRLHEAQFYSHDESFLGTFANFLASTICAGDTAVVVLTKPPERPYFKDFKQMV